MFLIASSSDHRFLPTCLTSVLTSGRKHVPSTNSPNASAATRVLVRPGQGSLPHPLPFPGASVPSTHGHWNSLTLCPESLWPSCCPPPPFARFQACFCTCLDAPLTSHSSSTSLPGLGTSRMLFLSPCGLPWRVPRVLPYCPTATGVPLSQTGPQGTPCSRPADSTLPPHGPLLMSAPSFVAVGLPGAF